MSYCDSCKGDETHTEDCPELRSYAERLAPPDDLRPLLLEILKEMQEMNDHLSAVRGRVYDVTGSDYVLTSEISYK